MNHHEHNILKLIIINFTQRFHLYVHAYALLLLSRGLTLPEIAAIESVVVGSIFLMEVPTGILADRIGRKWSIAASSALLMSAEAIFIFAQSYPLYLFIGFLTGTGFAFASGAVEAMVYDSLPLNGLPDADRRDNMMKRVMGRVGSWGQIAFFIAPIIGAIIIGDATPERFTLAIVLTVVSLGVGLLVSLTLHEPETDWDAERPSSLSILREGLSELRHNTRLRRLITLVIFVTPFTGTMIITFAPPYLTNNDVSPFMIGIALSVGSLLSAVTQRFAYKLETWFGQRNAILLLILLPGVMYWILSLIAGPIMALGVVVFMYATNDMKAPLFSAYQNALIKSKNRATMLSLINMFVNLYVAIAAPLYALIASQSLPAAFMLMGSVILLAGFTLYGRRREAVGVA